MNMAKKKDGKFVCRCECGGEVRGIKSIGRQFTWCESCTPVVKFDTFTVTE
jgi:hypothetical protein